MSEPTNLPVIQGVPLKGVYLKKRALKITRKNGDIEYVEVPAEAMEMGLRYAEREDYSCECVISTRRNVLTQRYALASVCV